MERWVDHTNYRTPHVTSRTCHVTSRKCTSKCLRIRRWKLLSGKQLLELNYQKVNLVLHVPPLVLLDVLHDHSCTICSIPTHVDLCWIPSLALPMALRPSLFFNVIREKSGRPGQFHDVMTKWKSDWRPLTFLLFHYQGSKRSAKQQPRILVNSA